MNRGNETFFEKHTLAIILIVLFYALTLPVIKNLYGRSCGPIILTGVTVSSLVALVIFAVLLVKMIKSKSYTAAEYLITLLLIMTPLIYMLSLYYRNFCK